MWSSFRRYYWVAGLVVLLYTISVMVRMNTHPSDGIGGLYKELDLRASLMERKSPLGCKKKTNVAFLKVHKAGSTTVMNIFIRFALKNDLNLVLPRRNNGTGFNYLGYGTTVDRSKIIPLPGNETYNILCNHVVYNKEAFDSVMPKDSVYVAIVREPKSHFISAASYYGFIHFLKKTIPHRGNVTDGMLLDIFLRRFAVSGNHSQAGLNYINNRQAFDFGVPRTLFRNKFVINKYIQKLDSEFPLVMLVEYFDESLVLMKRYLCWDLDEILYVPLNINKGKRNHPVQLPKDSEKFLHYFDYADFQLYDHFQKRFMDQMKLEGPDFQDEVNTFREIKSHVTTFCQSRPLSNRFINLKSTKWNSEFNVTTEDCKEMMMQELPMMRMLIDSANTRYRDWLRVQKFKNSRQRMVG
ncbi:galactosylceramide sulfotransferase-like [Saccostrea cucullata]|uniref:galactosylceramide sulfotransferase-like n=1 Tax=Saccostrea cuccullata TaxID=36930 RepID=UPI002ED419A4